MERLYKKMLADIQAGAYQITESGALVTDYGWIYEDMAHDIIIKTKRGDMRRVLPKSSELAKAFIKLMK